MKPTMQNELDRDQRMDAAAQFAGALGHDITNLLSIIHGFAELIQLKNQDNPDLLRSVEEILRAAKREKELCGKLLEFSRPRVPKLQEFDLNQKIRGMQEILRGLVGQPIRIQIRNVDHPLPVRLDPTSLEEIILALCINAGGAMQQGGTLTVETKPVTPGRAFQETHPWAVEEDSYILLSVQDTGVGMDPSMVDHVFEPFYIKKKFGRGTGLELATVYQLVRQQGGHVEVEADPARGTVFYLYFPQKVCE